MNWFVVPRPRPDAEVRLFCLPYAGGGASIYRQWPAVTGPEVEVLAVQPPGRESRFAEDPDYDLAELADALTARADGPYALYGHSLGGRVAFDLVRHQRRTGGPLPVKLYVGGCRAPHITSGGHFDGLSTLDDDELVRALAEGGGLSEEILAEPELLELLVPVLRADLEKLDRYVYVDEDPLPVPVVAFAGRADAAVPLADVDAWARHTSAGLTVHEVDGGHFFLHDDPSRIVDPLVKDLLSALPGRPA